MNALRFYLPLWALALPFLIQAQESELKVPDKQFELHVYQAAIQGYTAYLSNHPDDAMAMIRLARCYSVVNQPALAVDYFAKVQTKLQLTDQDLILYAQTLAKTGDYQRAEDIWSDLMPAYPVLAQQGIRSCQFARASATDKKSARVKGELINGPHSEIGPCWSNDHLLVNVFNPTLPTYPEGWVKGDQYHYLMHSTVDGNRFLYPPKPVKLDAKPTPNVGPVTYSPDGQTVIFMRASMSENVSLTTEAGFQSSLFIADVNANGNWENIRPFPFNNAAYSTAWPQFSPTGKELFFSSDKPNGLGGFDIYRTVFASDGWQEPQNLGTPINTPGNEITPFYSREMLFFASDWHTGLGGFDLFKAIRSNGRYTSIIHLGQEINSAGDDLGLITGKDPATGYFVSNRKGKGDLDLYQFQFQLIERHILIQDGVTGKPLADASIDLITCGGPIYRSSQEGLVTLQLTEIPSCQIPVQHPDYAVSYVNARDVLTGDEVYVINLTPDKWNFPVTVLDLETNKPLQHVQLRVTEQRSGQFTDLFTDEAGQLRVSLTPDKIYFLNFSLAGYLHEASSLQLTPSSTNPFVEPVKMKTILANVDPTKAPEENNAASDVPDVQSTPKAAFAVQVASLTNEKEADVRGFERLAQYGTVYQKIGDDRIRIRVGVFSSKENALAAAAEITGLGYPGSFVVEESVESLMDKVMLSMARNKTDEVVQEGEYLVRLAAYKNAQWFEPGTLGTYGTIKKETSKEWTIMFVGGIRSISTAREALRVAKESGFHEAHILFERNGKRLTVD